MINNSGGMEQAVAEKQTQVGGDWFFWIAGFFDCQFYHFSDRNQLAFCHRFGNDRVV